MSIINLLTTYKKKSYRYYKALLENRFILLVGIYRIADRYHTKHILILWINPNKICLSFLF